MSKGYRIRLLLVCLSIIALSGFFILPTNVRLKLMPPPLKDDVDNGFETAIDSRLIISPDNAEGMPDIVVEDGIEYQTLEFRRETVKEMMNHAWSNYVKYTWGGNELKPIARTANPTGIFGSTKLGASIVDAADTLFIMGMEKEFNDVRNWIQDHLILDGVNRDISVFELNIRFIGGLLSSHALSNDTIFLDKAVRFADRILPVFETSTGIPMALLNPTTNHSKIYPWASGALLGEVGSLHLEFTRLSFLTGNPIYAKKVQKIRDVLEKTPKIMADQLYPNYIHPWTGKWGQHYVSLGAFGDSFYEYLLKSYLQDVKDSRALKMYIDTMKGVEKKLLQISKESHMMYLASINYGSVEHEMTHLACFAGGLFALGSTVLDSPEREHHLQIGKNLTNTCHESYVRSPTGLGPESFSFASGAEAVASKYREKFYILRPEVVESYFVLYRLTKDPKYREWAWQVVESLNKHCRVDTGFVGIKNVYDLNSEKDDVQQSFVFAELFKYLYLIFCPDEVIDLKKWVFNTEGHPLPVHPRIS